MTALQWIIKEAKILRKKSPKMEWKKAVAQASAIYSSKHKGKSPVGKKKSAKKVVRKKAAKKVGTVKSKPYKGYQYTIDESESGNWVDKYYTLSDARKDLKKLESNDKKNGKYKKNFYRITFLNTGKTVNGMKHKIVKKRKPSEKSVLKSIKHAVSVQKSHMSGVNTHAINDYKEILGKIRYYENTIQMYREAIKNHKSRGISDAQLKNLKLWVKTHIKLLSEYKTHAKELKKHI
jgi:hypothetical protein